MKRTALLLAALALAACAGDDDYHTSKQLGGTDADVRVCEAFDTLTGTLNDHTEADEMISAANVFSYAAEQADDAELGEAAVTIAAVTDTFMYGTETQANNVSEVPSNVKAYATLLSICDSIDSPIRSLDEGAT